MKQPKTSAPTATYRLQLRNGMTFARAAELAPYLARLGISHLYLSPIFSASPGSTHGYDGIDFAEIEPELGGHEGFCALSNTMHAAGIGIILDIVPNHMSAQPLNPWWRSVLEWGANSPYANHFDVDWSAPKLIVPRLGDHYGTVLKSGLLRLIADKTTGEIELEYGEMRLPLNPPSYASVLTAADQQFFGALALRFATSAPAGAVEIKADLASLLADGKAAAALDRALEEINAHWGEIHKIHEQQVWRLAHWRTARENLTYRRFFEIAELVGVKVELPNVFDDVHREVLQLVGDGYVDGLRIDHIDGLSDPLGYLERLRAAIGHEQFYLVVEKILGANEDIRENWPVAGTTGYEFISAISQLLVDDRGQEDLTRGYEGFLGEQRDLAIEVGTTKRRTITRNLAGELDYLTDLASTLASEDIETRDLGRDTLRRGIVELASAMPVYRTYVDANGLSAADELVLNRAIEAARETREVEDEVAFEFIGRLFKLDFADATRRAGALQFAMRFQQTTGPLTAKAFEDTLFYRYNRLIAVNEVGGELDPLGGSVPAFHRAMQARLLHPLAMSATATHDTKRGEDARARIYTVSEAPLVWATAVQRWAAMNADLRQHEGSSAVPDPDTEWMFYQALLGAWPASLSLDDADALKALSSRLQDFLVKAAREAKLRTTWTQPDEKYEQGLKTFAEAALDLERSRPFLEDYAASVRPFIYAGVVNSLAQLAIKLFAPGVPDIYQGTEAWDLALVDPDNRRPVDFVAAAALLKAEIEPRALLQGWETAAIKHHILRTGLDLRRSMGDDVLAADYVPLEVTGPLAPRIIAFMRRGKTGSIVVVATRHAMGLLEEDAPRVAPHRWSETRINLPTGLPDTLTDILSRRSIPVANGAIDASDALRDLPVAILTSR